MNRTEQIELVTERLASGAGSISIQEACDMLHVSESTARRLFSDMERAGRALRVHGGLRRLPDSGGGYNFFMSEVDRISEKQLIGEAVAGMIAHYDTIFIDSGSTAAQVCAALAASARRGENPRLRIFTNSLKNLEILSGRRQIYLIGGEYRPYREDFCGFMAENAIGLINFDACVLGADGICPRAGLMTTDFSTARINELALNRSSTTIVAADSSKFDRRAPVTYAVLQSVNAIVTEAKPSAELAAEIKKSGAEIVVAEKSR